MAYDVGLDMQVKRGLLIFSTGKELYCYGNIVGLNIMTTGACGRISYGYDGIISTASDLQADPEFTEDVDKALTREESLELAEHMLSAWQAYKNAL